MIGAYLVEASSSSDALEKPEVQRLRGAFSSWEAGTPKDGKYQGRVPLYPLGHSGVELNWNDPVECSDGLIWIPPKTIPRIYDLARKDIPDPSVVLRLRRLGKISLPLGIGPVFGCGPRTGQPSTRYGQLLLEIYYRWKDRNEAAKNDPQVEADAEQEESAKWMTPEEIDEFSEMIFLAVQQCYHVTEEAWWILEPYDNDEMAKFYEAIWGLTMDPKRSGDGAATSQPSPQDS